VERPSPRCVRCCPVGCTVGLVGCRNRLDSSPSPPWCLSNRHGTIQGGLELAGLIENTIGLQKPEDGDDFGLDDRGLVLLLGNRNGIWVVGFDPSPVLLVEIGRVGHHHAVQELLLLVVLDSPEQK
jgi:hypothetical protein